MSLYQICSLPAPCNLTGLRARSSISVRSLRSYAKVPHRVRPQCTAATIISDQNVSRRSGNYEPCIWRYEDLQSLESEYVGEACNNRLKELKEDVRRMFDAAVDPLGQLKLIDNLQRLGVYYRFEDEIKSVLNRIYYNNRSNYNKQQESLYAVALEFRLLRKHGYDIPVENFDSFRDEKGSFNSCLFNADCKAILSLYEAAFLFKEGEESIFYEARNFATTYLKEYVKHNSEDKYLSSLVDHALELPLHWRIPRLEARWFIDVYARRQDMNPVLLDFAKLDFNIVQAIHQEDVKSASSWWKNSALDEKLSFARDRLMECFFWAVGFQFEPDFGYCRRMMTRAVTLITVIDDCYDVYGTLDELEPFTEVVNRWNFTEIKQLPYYLKMAFSVLHNSFNEMAFDILREHGADIISFLNKAWADLCKCFLVEAQWYYSGYTPTLEEYLDNAWISISAPTILTHAYFLVTRPITKEDIESFQQYNNIIRWSSLILRLADDLGTSSYELKRGDVPKSIQCHMNDTGVSEEEAREHIHELIATTWMKLNKDRLANPQLSDSYVEYAMNVARMSQCMYQFGDGHGIKISSETKDRVLSLFVNPIL